MVIRSKWLKGEIKALEKIQNRSIGQEYELYNLYCVADHVPFGPYEYSEKTITQWDLIKDRLPEIIKYLHRDD